MKILLVNLPRYKKFSVTREGRCELISNNRIDTPTTLLTIASLLRKQNHQIIFIDANAFDLDYEDVYSEIKNKKFDCVIFSFNSMILEHEFKICKIVKTLNPSSITIGFSWYARNFAMEILNEYNYLDIIITEDVLSIIEKLITTLDETGNLDQVYGIGYRNKIHQIKINNKLNKVRNINELPIPAYDMLPTFEPYHIYLKDLRPYALVYSGKGCPYGCHFCNVANTIYSNKSAEKLIEELIYLKKLTKVKYIWFFDEIFTINRDRVIKICKEIQKKNLKIKWFCDTRVDLVDKELLKSMRKGGCIGVAYGVESGSQKILNSMNKKITIEQARKALIWTRKAHIPIQLNMILGYIGENENTFKETESFIKVTLPEFLQVVPIMGLDGTKFTELAIENNWIDKDLNWKDRLKTQVLKSDLYEPFNLNLKKKIRKLHKILFFNPIWWLTITISLIRNYTLIYPLIKFFFNKIPEIKYFYKKYIP